MSELKLELRVPSETLLENWDGLADRLGAAPFLRAGWTIAWSRAFAPARLRLLCALDGGELAGLLPFLDHRGVRSSPTNWHTPFFGWLARDQGVRTALAHRALDRVRTRVDFAFLDSEDAGLAALARAARARRQQTIVRTVLRSPYVQLDESEWEHYLASLSRSTRREARRLRRRLDEQGDVRLDFARGGSRLSELLDEGLLLEGSGWKDEQRSAIVSHEATRNFYAEVARWADARGELLLAFLRLDGRAIAFDLCMECNGTVYVLKGGFDPAFRRFGPGMILTYESLRRAFEQGLRSYELLGDDDPYKLMWTQRVRKRVRVQVFADSAPGQISRLAWSHGRTAWHSANALAQRLRGTRPTP